MSELEKANQQAVVLAIQDTTDLGFSSLKQTTGLGFTFLQETSTSSPHHPTSGLGTPTFLLGTPTSDRETPTFLLQKPSSEPGTLSK